MGNVFIPGASPIIPYNLSVHPDFSANHGYHYNATSQVMLVLCWAHLIPCTKAQSDYLKKYSIPPAPYSHSTTVPATYLPAERAITFSTLAEIFPTTTSPPVTEFNPTLPQVDTNILTVINSPTTIVSSQDDQITTIPTSETTSTTPSYITYVTTFPATDEGDIAIDNNDMMKPLHTVFDVAREIVHQLDRFAINLLDNLVNVNSPAAAVPLTGNSHTAGHAQNVSTRRKGGAKLKPLTGRKKIYRLSSSVKQSSDAAIGQQQVVAAPRRPHNVVFSPTSIATVLVLTYLGSNGQTRAELSEVLGASELKLGRRKYVQAFSVFLSGLTEPRTAGNELLNAQRILVQAPPIIKRDKIDDSIVDIVTVEQQVPSLNPEYLAVLRSDYGAEISTVQNFESQSHKVSEEVNTWVSNKTRGHITQILQASDLNDFTRLIILDATYFHGEWAETFKSAETAAANFYVSKDETVTVDMMRKKGKYKSGYLPILSAQFLEIPFKNSELSFYVFLPISEEPDVDPSQAMTNMIERIDIEELREMFRKSETYDTNIYLPKFNISSNVDMKEPLQKLGLKTLFDPSTANLPHILTNSTHSEPLYVSDFKHRAVFLINEQGATAGAASIAVISARRSPYLDDFRVDRPFLFMVVDNRVLATVFMGAIYNPNE